MDLHTDSEIEQWVLRELSLHEQIRSREICVFARDGVVRLQGSTQSYSDRLAVEEATRGAPGVVCVVNEMKVKVPTGLIAERSGTSALAVPRSAHVRAQLQSQ
jgi:osmotically-inducible protein OsmY